MTVIHPNLEAVEAKMSATDVSVFYGDKKAIDNVSIAIPSKYVTAADKAGTGTSFKIE